MPGVLVGQDKIGALVLRRFNQLIVLSRKLMGMFMGISEGDWLELWSGFIGALVSAVLAALVAVLVVWRTNKHQSGLAKSALAAQREDAATALKVQRDLLERQIREQREEARRAERHQALARFIAGVRELSFLHSETELISIARIGRELEAAAAALDILGEEDEGLHELLHPSIRPLVLLSTISLDDFQAGLDSDAYRKMTACASAICDLSPKWWSREEGHERRFIRSEIRLNIQAAEKHLNEMKTS